MSISYAVKDPRDGTIWAAMDHAHWGPKLSRSKDDGATWENLSQLAYPKGARFIEQHLPLPGDDPSAERPTTYKDAALLKVWVLAFGGSDQPGTIHAGTLPGGLFTSRDGGESWELNRPLWNHESRGGDLSRGRPRAATSGAARRPRSPTASSCRGSIPSWSTLASRTACWWRSRAPA
jgi:hypothetical protein